jgi:hypothetical protein
MVFSYSNRKWTDIPKVLLPEEKEKTNRAKVGTKLEQKPFLFPTLFLLNVSKC